MIKGRSEGERDTPVMESETEIVIRSCRGFHTGF